MKEAEASGRVALAQKLNDQMQKLEEQAAAFSIPNEFGATLSQAGAAGLNATTSHDATRYFMAMPANKLELWFALEAERFRVSHNCNFCQIFIYTLFLLWFQFVEPSVKRSCKLPQLSHAN